MQTFTRGQATLAERVEATKGGQSGIARRLGMDPSSISNLARGESRPSLLVRKKIEIVLGIPEDDWLTNEECAELAELRLSTESSNGNAAA